MAAVSRARRLGGGGWREVAGRVVCNQGSRLGRGGARQRLVVAHASFDGNVGLFCLSLDGDILWKKTGEPQSIYLGFGTASSPVVQAGRVYVVRDSEGESFLTARPFAVRRLGLAG